MSEREMLIAVAAMQRALIDRLTKNGLLGKEDLDWLSRESRRLELELAGWLEGKLEE